MCAANRVGRNQGTRIMATQLRLWPGHGERDGIVCNASKANPQMGSRRRNARADRAASSNTRTRGNGNRKVGKSARVEPSTRTDRGGVRKDSRGVDGKRLEGGSHANEVTRRTRLAAGLPPRLSRWLRRVTRTPPERLSGNDDAGTSFSDRSGKDVFLRVSGVR